MLRNLRRLVMFSLVPGLSLLATLVLLPMISARYGPAGWVAVSVGQSMGAIVSIVGGLAWPILGGHKVASTKDDRARAELFQASVVSRLMVTLGLAVPAAVAAALLVDDFRLEASLFMVGVAFNALTASWYFAGTGHPGMVIRNEAAVRLGAYAFAAVCLALGGGLIWYAATMAVSGVLMLALNWVAIVGWKLEVGHVIRPAVTEIREQVLGTGSRTAVGAFSFGGPTIFSLVAPSSLPLFTALDQVHKAAMNALLVSPQAFIAWIGEASGHEQAKRGRRSLQVGVALALTFIAGWMLVGGPVLNLLFQGHVHVALGGQLLLACAVASTLATRCYQYFILVPRGLHRTLYRLDIGAAFVGLALTALGAVTLGAYGGLLAWTMCQLSLLGSYAVVRTYPGLASRLQGADLELER